MASLLRYRSRVASYSYDLESDHEDLRSQRSIFGAYGSDSPDRAELTKLAIDKANRLHDELTPAQVFVVGDTPRDIEATKAAGAVSVGVASGHYSTKELVAAGGDYVLNSLEDLFPGM